MAIHTASPTVTVIIPTYNRAHLVARALRSVLAQTFQDMEIIVVDDGSTDDTEVVVHAFGDSRIRYLRHATRRGGPAARNTGIRASRGEFIALLDSDDEWLPEKLERQLRVARTTDLPRVGAVVCSTRLVDGTNGTKGYVASFRGDIYEPLLAFRGMGSVGSSLLARGELARSGIFFDETLPALQDWDYFVQIAKTYQVETVVEPLVIQHWDNTTQHVWSEERVLRAHQLVLEKYAAELYRRPSTKARHHKRLALCYYSAGDIGAIRRHLRCAFDAHPRELWLLPWIAVAAMGFRPFQAMLWVVWWISWAFVGLRLLKGPVTPFR